MKHYDRVVAEIDLDAILHNMETMKANIAEQTKMLATIKTDGYGHGAVPIAREIEPLPYVFGFATATVEEALILRHIGVQKPILILGHTFPYCYEDLIRKEIRPAVFREDMVRELSEKAVALGKKCKVHIKVDTMMCRIGIRPNDEGIQFIKLLKELEGIEIEGIFSHFSKADETDKTSAYKQLSVFNDFTKKAEEILGCEIPMKHCSNSAGLIDLKEANLDLVRPGVSIYGMWPSDEVEKANVDLKPALSLKSHIVYVKKVEKGSRISYGGTYLVEKDMMVATVPVGYGDGYPRGLSNKGYMLIHGEKAQILGRVCMDQCMVDVTHIKGVKEGDEVTLIGKDGENCITMEELGEISGRFNYELACDLGKRIPRTYWKNGKLVGSKDYFSDYE